VNISKKITHFIEKPITAYIIIVLSFAVRVLLAVKYSQVTELFDENLHLQMAKSISYYHQTIVRGFSFYKNDWLYSYLGSVFVTLLPFKYVLASLRIFNVVLMTGGVIIFYLLSVKIIINRKICLIVLLTLLVMPEFFYSFHIMQECLSFAMFAVFMFLTYCIWEKREQNKIIFVCEPLILGFLLVILFLCKALFLSLFIGVVMLLLFKFLLSLKRKKYFLGNLYTFGGTLLSFFIFFALSRLFYDLTNLRKIDYTAYFPRGLIGSHGISINSVLLAIYPYLIYIVFLLIGTGLLLYVFIIGSYKNYKSKEKDLLSIISLFAIVNIGVVIFLIAIVENPNQSVIRMHYRYFYYIFPIVAILFFKMYDSDNYDSIWRLGILFGIFSVMILTLDFVPFMGSGVDSMHFALYYKTFKYITNNITNDIINADILQSLYRFLFLTIIIIGMYFLLTRKRKYFYILAVSYLILSSILNSSLVLYYSVFMKGQFQGGYRAGLEINEYIKSQSSGNKTIMFITDTTYNSALLELGIEQFCYVTQIESIPDSIDNETRKINFSDLKLLIYNSWGKREFSDPPEWIVVYNAFYDLGFVFPAGYHEKKQIGAALLFQYDEEKIIDDYPGKSFPEDWVY
jgi:hypothetical protein